MIGLKVMKGKDNRFEVRFKNSTEALGKHKHNKKQYCRNRYLQLNYFGLSLML